MAAEPQPAAAPAPGGRSGPASWTTRALLNWMAGAFEKKGLDSPRLCAELLLSHALGCDRLRLYMEADRPATPLERDLLRGLVARALKNEPVQYLVGEAWFFSLPFAVDRRVLIPRPSTETIVEHLLQQLRASPGLAPGGHALIADVCTGSGCVGVALLKNLPAARCIATDLSGEALEVARANAARHGVSDRVEFLPGDLLAPLRAHPGAGRLHALVSNPPYIPDHEWESDDPEKGVGESVKRYEPEGALRGGPDGLRFAGPIIDGAPDLLLPGGLLLVEVASSAAESALRRALAHPSLEQQRVLDDFEGLPRVIGARKKPDPHGAGG